MKPVNQAKLTIDSRSQNESFIRLAASGFFAVADPDIAALSEIKTALSEAVTNAIVHGYKDCIGKIHITFRLFDDGTAYMKVQDKGCGIEDIDKAMQPLFTTAAEEERAGLGFAVMQAFTDKLRVVSKPQRGTTVIMQKKLGSRQNG